MKHLGDITKIDCSAVPPVNVIIGGAPCQDLSVAGKRAGLAGERSGLFMEQIRIIKEMRKADADRGRTGVDIRPRFMVWENVTGAFSSNKGADFGAVLQETLRVVCEKAPAVPMPRNGWPTSGCLMDVGGQWSIAWRVFDAQFWGVPQRRRRIALVADFGGLAAPEILFERQGVSGDYPQSRTPWKRTAADAQRGVGETDAGVKENPTYCIQGNCIDRADTAGCNGKGWTEDVSYTLNTVDRPAVCGFSYKAGSKANGIGYDSERSSTLSAQRHDAAVVIENHPNDSCVKLSEDKIVQTLSGRMGTGGGDTPMVMETYRMRGFGDYKKSDVSGPCKARDCKDATDLICAVNCRNGTESTNINGTLQAKESGGYSLNLNNVVRQRYIVRRLTPLECERLQGFPDGWTDIGEWTDTKGKAHKESADSARYKALGNSIAIPPWFYVLSKLSLCCGSDCTMASLFDGIGVFPLIWETLNGKGSCMWASEIEEFPIAVTKRHFPDAEQWG